MLVSGSVPPLSVKNPLLNLHKSSRQQLGHRLSPKTLHRLQPRSPSIEVETETATFNKTQMAAGIELFCHLEYKNSFLKDDELSIPLLSPSKI